MGNKPQPKHFEKIPDAPRGEMVITRDFLAKIGFERENDGARPYKSPDVEIWNRSDFDMPVAFHKKGSNVKSWPNIEKVPIADFVRKLLARQKAHIEEYFRE